MEIQHLFHIAPNVFVAGVLAAVTQIASAAPIEYRLSGTFGDDASSPPLEASQYPVPVGTPIDITFTYDSSKPDTVHFVNPAFSNLQGTVGNHHFSSSQGYLNWAFMAATFGTQPSTGNPSTDLQGFTANGLTLTAFNQGFSGIRNTGIPPIVYGPTLGFLYFTSTTDGTQHAYSIDGELLETVPVPSAAFLFGSGLLGVASIARKRKSI